MLYQNTQYHSVQQSLQTPNIPQQSFAGPHAGMNLCRICDVASSLQLHGPHLSTLLIRHCRILYTRMYGDPSTPHILVLLSQHSQPPQFQSIGRVPIVIRIRKSFWGCRNLPTLYAQGFVLCGVFWSASASKLCSREVGLGLAGAGDALIQRTEDGKIPQESIDFYMSIMKNRWVSTVCSINMFPGPPFLGIQEPVSPHISPSTLRR